MISVCMATYNGERYLREQLDSVLCQIGDGDEFLVSDDGSQDATLSILSEYATVHTCVKVLDGPHRGVVANFSSVLAHSSGGVVFLSDQDDVWAPNKVERVLAAFSANPGCGVVVHDARFIDGDDNAMGQTLFGFRGSRAGFVKNLTKNSYVGCCMAVSRDVLDVALPIPEGLEMHDWWIGLVGECVASPVFIGEELIGYRRHEGNVSELHHHPLGLMLSNRAGLLSALSRRGWERGRWL